MNTISTGRISKRDIWAGRILAGMVTFILLGSSLAKISGASKMVEGLTHAGIPRSAILPIAALELACLALYLIPRTTMLGTLLLTGYFGGATLTHVIGGESLLPPLIAGLAIWAGAYFRVPELQNLLPLRKDPEVSGADQGARSQQPIPTRG
jgi:hypothetical protein